MQKQQIIRLIVGISYDYDDGRSGFSDVDYTLNSFIEEVEN